jgi:citrate/tricarballylate utilization protein
MPPDDLFQEARRQLTVCNSCRYCEGYCPVWPALELRTALTAGDITHLSNLCHDCGDCFTACMYTAPHEFDLNPPRLFAEVREQTYRTYLRPPRLPPWLRGWRGLLAGLAASAALLTVLGLTTRGSAADGRTGLRTGSPYAVVAYLALVAVVGAAFLWAVAVIAVAAARYWRETHGPLRDLLDLRSWGRALRYGVQLRHMTGGGEQCSYPDGRPSSARKRFHLALTYGFALCLVSTTAAAIMQDLLGLQPPYGYLSVPVVTGTAGGLGMAVGCVGLAVLKRRSDPALGTDSMRAADFGLLWALLLLSGTGLLTLVLRATPAFATVLLVHLAAVVACVLVAPYTKFVHWIYRLLAIYQDNLDTRE